MARVAFPLVLQSPSSGSAIVGATATITQHVVGGTLGAGPAATIYTSETGAGVVTGNQIVSDSSGRWTQGSGAGFAQYWLAQGTYDIAVSGTGLTTYAITRELLSAGLSDQVNLAGELKMWAGAAAPSGFLLCDGSAISRTTYAILFAAIGTAFGAGDGTTTFNVPDMRGRFPLGKAPSGTGSVLGSSGGALGHTHVVKNHSHSLGNMYCVTPNHTHGFNGGYALVGATFQGVAVNVNGSSATLVWTGPQALLNTDPTSIVIPNSSFGGAVGPIGSPNNGDIDLGSGAADPAFQTVNYIVRTGLQ